MRRASVAALGGRVDDAHRRVAGAVFGLGLITVGLALRPVAPAEVAPRRQGSDVRLNKHIENFTIRLALGLFCAIVLVAITRWPVAGLIAGTAGFMAPTVLGGGAARQARLDRTEAIATWAEMLRDTMAGAGGLEQSIIASAAVAPPAIRAEVLRLAARLERERPGALRSASSPTRSTTPPATWWWPR